MDLSQFSPNELKILARLRRSAALVGSRHLQKPAVAHRRKSHLSSWETHAIEDMVQGIESAAREGNKEARKILNQMINCAHFPLPLVTSSEDGPEEAEINFTPEQRRLLRKRLMPSIGGHSFLGCN